MYLVYRLLLAAAFPLVILYLLIRSLRDRRYLASLPERLGRLPASVVGTAEASIWLHAVSVGEVLSAVRLLERLRAAWPAREIFVSSTTLAGRAVAEEKLRGLVDGVFYAPLDYCFAVRNLLRRLRPSVIIIFETEIWPNLYREVKRSGAALVIVNGRISDRAFPRYRAVRGLLRRVLAHPDVILAQNDVAVRRYVELGAPAERVRLAGNLKYDFDPGRASAPEAVTQLVRRLAPEPVWIAASTMPGAWAGDVDEDEAVLDAFVRLAATHPRLLLVLAPRRPERFEAAAEKLARRGIPFLRRTGIRGDETPALPCVLLLDSIGELSGLFRFADVVFMGGTLAARGGHNLLEPAFFGCPVIAGPHFENFPDIAGEFRRAGALVEIAGPEKLATAVAELAGDSERRRRLGQRGRELAEARRGATERAMAEIVLLSRSAIRKPLRWWTASILLWPLSRLWELGVGLRRTRALARQKRLATPVLSVGNLAVGGAGKTPFVLHLAERLAAGGLKPGILTRGYRRRFPTDATVLPAGARAPAALTGDEAQILVRSGVAAVGIGADRYRVGKLLEERFTPDVILLDDGFAHWRLARTIDLVLIDALDPFGGEALFPLGRLREPLAALARADLLLISRAEPDLGLDAIETRLRALNPRAPIFRCRFIPRAWVNLATGEEADPQRFPDAPAGAFCGLANPASFWRSLRALGCQPALRWEFPDHHHYRPWQLRRLAAQARAAGARVLLTTEKDTMNLPEGAAALVAPLEIWWLRIGVEVEDEPRLLGWIERRLEAAGGPAPPSTGAVRETSY